MEEEITGFFLCKSEFFCANLEFNENIWHGLSELWLLLRWYGRNHRKSKNCGRSGAYDTEENAEKE